MVIVLHWKAVENCSGNFSFELHTVENNICCNQPDVNSFCASLRYTEALPTHLGSLPTNLRYVFCVFSIKQNIQ